MKRWWINLAIVVVLVTAGCGGVAASSPSPILNSGGPRPMSGVEGRVLTSGGPVDISHPPSPRPYPASEVAAFDSAGRLVALVRPARDADFRIELPPGSYTLKARPTTGNPWFAPRKVSVDQGKFARVDLVAQIP